MICRICGNEKEDRDFHKLKNHIQYKLKHRVWCRSCQKMYVDMLLIQEKKKTLVEAKANHVVVFI